MAKSKKPAKLKKSKPAGKPKAAGRSKKAPKVSPIKASPKKAKKPKAFLPAAEAVAEVIGKLDLGPVVLPSADQALEVLGKLAELNDRTLQAHANFQESQKRTKNLKDKWEGLAEELQRELRQATHPKELPLFDHAEREADLARMTDGGKAPETAHEPVETPNDDQVPF